MKSKQIALATLLLSALSTTALANSDNLLASSNSNPSDLSSSQNASAAPPPQVWKTRAQVHQELIEARRAGTIPTTEADYPPSQRTIEANRAHHQVLERYWASND
ncbi:DUF4148 domain-containing protein [Paraburkholderia phytofirmans]|uniref:DUF4148 domain-containing protein n=1 Tax=Paraburkholderia phytofirmans TaxID=261302 RepID=UPI0007B60CC5|nr:DUF4148 domain-containing protein [Paraburkholderia phytofirmans]